jgi:hypothetical protein
MSTPNEEDDNGEVKVTFEEIEIEPDVEDKDEIDPTQPLNAFGEQIVNLSPKIITGEDEEEELQVQDEDTTSILKLLEGQTVWMQKIENKVDKLQNHLSAIDGRLQPANISKSDMQSLPIKISEKSSIKRKSVKKTKGNSRPSPPVSETKKSRKMSRKNKRK